jgi:CheY-like chemotaxis protein
LGTFWTVADQEPKVTLTGLKVVIVDDQQASRMIASKMASLLGMQVVGEAEDGKDGVEIVLRERPDIVVMDLFMPVVDGLAATKRILSQLSVCIVLSTASYSEEYAAQARSLGCDFLKKPLLIDTFGPKLVAAYQRFLRDTTSETQRSAA